MRGFWVRLAAIVIKEIQGLRRDRLSFSLMLGLPILELLLFGYAINTDPHRLPTAVIAADQSALTRTVLTALGNTNYMDFTHRPATEAEANALLQSGEVQFVVRIPSDFTRRLIRGERTQVLIDADATDPMTISASMAHAGPAIEQALKHDLVGPLAAWSGREDAIELVLHRRYNPEGKSRLNIVPGLLAVILSGSMVLMTALAITRERELGTMETLLATPVRPIEVMIGKILPYFVVGALQTTMILALSWSLFDITIEGSLPLLVLGTALFIFANLAIGFTISTVTESQMQATQVSFFFLLPTILLSGFMFPFRGMPEWAQWLGEMMPATHYIRITRGVILKAAIFDDVDQEMAALIVIVLATAALAIGRYRMTLDTAAKPAA
ncbi:MAG: ABC transporter permease [Rhodospirillales bacterium]|nr:ABC transporter permease [Rhodospirillales bacterium]